MLATIFAEMSGFRQAEKHAAGLRKIKNADLPQNILSAFLHLNRGEIAQFLPF